MLEPAGECNLAAPRRTQPDLGWIVNVSPLGVGLVEEVPSAGGQRELLAEVVRSVHVHSAVAEEFRCVSVIGIARSHEAEASCFFKMCSADLPEIHPKIRACRRHVCRLRA